MLKFCSLYSGSSGNSLYVESNNTKILIDAGVSGKKIVEALASLNVDINDINGLLVTHEHLDHTLSLSVLSKKYNIPIYANEKTWSVLPTEKIYNRQTFEVGKTFSMGDLKIEPFPIPHDAISPCAFNIYTSEEKISVATDIGHITPEIVGYLKNSSFLLLEANYEPEMLHNSSYPYHLKQRILGNNGHLSNENAGQLITELYKYGLKEVMLGHLSKENNFPELAYQTVVNELHSNNISLNNLHVHVAERNKPSSIIDITSHGNCFYFS